MKLNLVALFFFAIVVLSASGTSAVDCSRFRCVEETCANRDDDCACGGHRDTCNCCTICYRCPEEACNPSLQNVCTTGHTCVLNDTAESFASGGSGQCKPEIPT
ncbi:uncharacterized protein LOC144137925 [Haemaphysalis longicornis]